MGFWGCRSFDNDAVEDELSTVRHKNSNMQLTEDQLDKYLAHKLQFALSIDEKEKEMQIALGSMPFCERPICFLGMVIYGLNKGFHFQSVVLDAALAAGYVLLKDKEGLRRWKHPTARKKRIAKEILMITEENSNIYRNQNFIRMVLRKFLWEINSRY